MELLSEIFNEGGIKIISLSNIRPIIIFFHSSQCRLIPYLHQRPIFFKANSSIVAILELIRGAQCLIELMILAAFVDDQKEVANHFNNFFSTVAESIGKDTVYDPSDHPSLIEIKKQNDCTNKFVFEKVSTDKVEKIINNINIKKATGADGIPAKIIKCSKSIIAPQITSILNMSTDQNVFPDKLKKAQVTPLYKKNDPLLKTNNRPVSVLCIFSKIFEKILEQQFFENIINAYLCAFRRGHGCQTTLLRLLEDWRNALEKKSVCCCSPSGSFQGI